jgi:SAM-dependent MidA family methyltransferase
MAEAAGPQWATWRVATERALYGEGGFYRRTPGPAAHFRTSVHASPLFAGAVLCLARAAGLRTVVDVGSGRGELLRALHALRPGLGLVGVERAARPAGLPEQIDWLSAMPEGVEALVVANEWLDDVPLDVVELTVDGPRLVEVDPATGHERLGPPPSGSDLSWLDRWWPLSRTGDRAEVGRPRDEAWAAVVRRLRRGIAVAVDYDHLRGDRPRTATLTGYAHGSQVAPVPDGSCDVTSHVALDACAAAGQGAGSTWTLLATQRAALRALGVDASLPDLATARSDPAGYVAALSRASQAGELVARGGLGDFGWLVQGVGTAVPAPLAQVASRTDS